MACMHCPFRVFPDRGARAAAVNRPGNISGFYRSFIWAAEQDGLLLRDFMPRSLLGRATPRPSRRPTPVPKGGVVTLTSVFDIFSFVIIVKPSAQSPVPFPPAAMSVRNARQLLSNAARLAAAQPTAPRVQSFAFSATAESSATRVRRRQPAALPAGPDAPLRLSLSSPPSQRLCASSQTASQERLT